MRLVRLSVIPAGSARLLTNLGRRLWQNRQGAIHPGVPYSANLAAVLNLPFLSDEQRQFSAFNSVERDSRKPMSTDAEYEAFLEKANQDRSTGGAGKETAVTASQSKSPSLITVNTAVPAALQDIQEFLISDADEPFEPISLIWTENKMPSTGMYI